MVGAAVVLSTFKRAAEMPVLTLLNYWSNTSPCLSLDRWLWNKTSFISISVLVTSSWKLVGQTRFFFFFKALILHLIQRWVKFFFLFLYFFFYMPTACKISWARDWTQCHSSDSARSLTTRPPGNSEILPKWSLQFISIFIYLMFCPCSLAHLTEGFQAWTELKLFNSPQWFITLVI